MAKKNVKTQQEKRKEENSKVIQKQEQILKKMKQQTKGFNPGASLLNLFEKISALIFSDKMGGSKAPNTAQNTLPYLQLFSDGLCRVTDTFYSKSIEFDDINYQLSSDDSKSSIFNRYCAMLNSFQTDVSVQLTFHNTMLDPDVLRETVNMPNKGDDLDKVREGYSGYLMQELSTGQNEIERKKYITFGVEASSANEARRRLARVEQDVLKHLRKSMKCPAKVVRGKERVELLFDTIKDNPKNKLNFDFKNQKKSGLRSKDSIAPSGFDFRQSKMFGIGDRWARASFFKIEASQLYDYALADILDTEGASLTSLHIEIIDHEKAIKNVKSKITDIGSMKVEHNKRANRDGYGMDILPPDISTFEEESAEVLESLEKKDERFFLITLTVVNFADTKAQLDSYVQQLDSIARRHGLPLSTLTYQQEQGFQSALPFAQNTLPIQRGMTTKGVGVLVPFNVKDINMGIGSLCYGFNVVSRRMILVNRSELTNPNGVIVGIPGSGKSMSSKMEISQIKLTQPNDDIIIVDPEGEYKPLVQRLGGEVIRLAPNSPFFINPLEINMNYGSEGTDDEVEVNPVYFKTDLILSLFEIILDGKILAIERSVIDRCARAVYEPYLKDPKPENIPILEDMYNYLKEQPEREALHVASALEVYVYGTLNYFNHRTNIDINNSLICFNIKELQKELQDMGMLVLQDQVWNRVTLNREKKKKTWYYVDEFHLLLRTEQTSAYMVEIWKRFRKWGGIPTGITQNVKDFMATIDAKNILDNSPFIRILEQAPSDGRILADYLDISDDQLDHVFSPEIGGGLIRMGTTIIPFKNELPDDNILFKYITTKLSET